MLDADSSTVNHITVSSSSILTFSLIGHASSNSDSTTSILAENGFSAGAQAVNRSFVASLAFLFYDILLTFDEEVELIWTRSWSPFKFLYFYVRYVPLMIQIPLLLIGSEVTPQFHFTERACYAWQIYQGVVSIVILAPVDYVLVARIYALYHNSRVIQILVSVCYLACIVLMSVGAGLSIPGLKFDAICHTTDVPRAIILNGAAEVAFQTLLFVLTLYKLIISVRRDGWSSVRGVPILKLIVRDGTWAFFVLFSIVLTQAIVYVAGKEGGILFGWLLSGFSFCGYRILLNLNHLPRSRHVSPANESHSRTTTSSTTELSFSNPSTGLLSRFTEYIEPVGLSHEWDRYGFDGNMVGVGERMRTTRYSTGVGRDEDYELRTMTIRLGSVDKRMVEGG